MNFTRAKEIYDYHTKDRKNPITTEIVKNQNSPLDMA